MLDGFNDAIHVSRRYGAVLERRRRRSLIASPTDPVPQSPGKVRQEGMPGRGDDAQTTNLFDTHLLYPTRVCPYAR